MEKTDDTRLKLIHAAANLFREHGYHGTAMSDVLERAGVPKGSLYHHFPGGKSELALQSAQWAGDWLACRVEATLTEAETLEDGVARLCGMIADLFDRTHWTACPINATLLDGSSEPRFRNAAEQIMTGWRNIFVASARGHGYDDAAATRLGDHLLMLLEGAWVVARAEQRSDRIRQIPGLIVAR